MTAERRAAFFDVDGTLTTAATIFRFLEYWLAAGGEPPHVYRHRRQELRAMTATGASRTETNRAYFAAYSGHSARRVAETAEKWFETEQRSGGLLHLPAVDRLRRHQRRGDLVVLVSGSFPAALAPVSRLLSPDAVICSEPEIVDGRYTGTVHQPMISTAKADAVRRWAKENGVSLQDSTAYGDHPSDLPMLEATGRSVVIGSDPVMRERARCEGWRQLPGPPPPPPLVLPALPAPR
ncbi:HAD-IB family hydrolase [Streptomyces sodiiphilus]|uniref:HAD-IB family hydrolase n=1 Tax=Streptomyces sodiiphilus TaxID=226217 RepID=A0ABN2P4L4_9ACTN